jgi:glutamate-5-semialdehyde dehydrogenase
VSLWHQALTDNKMASWVEYLNYNRMRTQTFLETNAKVDLIVPRGGENLINFVKKHDLSSNCEW